MKNVCALVIEVVDPSVFYLGFCIVEEMMYLAWDLPRIQSRTLDPLSRRLDRIAFPSLLTKVCEGCGVWWGKWFPYGCPIPSSLQKKGVWCGVVNNKRENGKYNVYEKPSSHADETNDKIFTSRNETGYGENRNRNRNIEFTRNAKLLPICSNCLWSVEEGSSSKQLEQGVWVCEGYLTQEGSAVEGSTPYAEQVLTTGLSKTKFQDGDYPWESSNGVDWGFCWTWAKDESTSKSESIGKPLFAPARVAGWLPWYLVWLFMVKSSQPQMSFCSKEIWNDTLT